MIYFTTYAKDLKKALSVTILATVNEKNTIHSHALFKISEDQKKVTLWSTDGDKIAQSNFPISVIEGDIIDFTANPRSIQDLISNSDSKEISFSYNPDNKTLKVYTSDDKDSFISFFSFNSDNILIADLSNQKENGKINSQVFSKGIKFIQGFFAKSDKDKKYSNLYISNGTMYGSDGNTLIGAYKSSDLEGIPELAIRKQMLSSISTLIDKVDTPEITIKSSDKYITISSEEGAHYFGFRQSISKMPRLPINTEIPETDGYKIITSTIMKKIKRLSLSSWEELAVKGTFDESDILKMETLLDRPSVEKMQCERIAGDREVNFLISIKKMKNILNLFEAPEINFYFEKTSCTIYSKADLEIIKGDKEKKEIITKPVIAIALLKLAREDTE